MEGDHMPHRELHRARYISDYPMTDDIGRCFQVSCHVHRYHVLIITQRDTDGHVVGFLPFISLDRLFVHDDDAHAAALAAIECIVNNERESQRLTDLLVPRPPSDRPPGSDYGTLDSGMDRYPRHSVPLH